MSRNKDFVNDVSKLEEKLKDGLILGGIDNHVLACYYKSVV